MNYPLGELILVVVGIFIALQINNWNEERIEQRQTKEYAYGLIQDLKSDVVMSEAIRADINLILQRIDALSTYVRRKPADGLRNIDLFYLMREPFYRPYTWNRTSFEQIESSGALRQIRNQQLAEKISAYAAFTHHLDRDFEFDRTVSTKAIELAIKIVDISYPDVNLLLPISQICTRIVVQLQALTCETAQWPIDHFAFLSHLSYAAPRNQPVNRQC